MHSESLHNTNPSQPFQMLWAVFYTSVTPERATVEMCYGIASIHD